MAPAGLSSTYQRYKQDTNVVASWLASTALACGYASDRLKQPVAAHPAPSSSGRLKGKNREEAKRAKQQQGSQPNTKQPKHIIAVADFVTLAEFIASSKSSSASLPDFFIEALDRVISLRSSFRDRLEDKGVNGKAASEDGHSYFIQILNQVRTTLKPLISTARQREMPLLNRFEALKLYKPSQAFLDAAPPPSAPAKGQPPAWDTSFEAEQFAGLTEVVFAWNMMNNDLIDLRRRIMDIWADYRVGGHFDAATAALATNTAIDLARSIIDEVLPLAEPHGGCWRIVYILCGSQALDQNMDPAKPGLAGALNDGKFELVRDTLVEMHTLIAPLAGALVPMQLPFFDEGKLKAFDPASDREAMSGEEKMQEDRILLSRLATEQMIVIQLLPDYPVTDEFLRGMKELYETREVSFSLAFAARVHLDIHHTLRTDASSACKSLLKASQVLQDDITAHLDLHKPFKSSTWSAAKDKVLQNIQKEIRWVCADPIHQVKATILRREGTICPPDLRPHLLLSWLPVMAGLMLFRLRGYSWTMGMSVSRAWGSILYSAHLYDAMQNEGLLTGDRGWHDMDMAKALFGHEKFYVGDPPKTRAEYVRKFCLSLGASAAIFAPPKGCRKTQHLESRAGPRRLEGDPAVSRMLFPRYLDNSGQLNWTPDDIRDIVSRSQYEQEILEADEMSYLVRSNKLPKNRQQQEAAAAAAAGLLSPSELIQKLALGLHAESLELSFDYLRMHRECWKFLRAIREACDPVLRRLYTPIYMQEEEQLPIIVGWILAALDFDFGDEVSESLMRSCAGVIEGVIAREEGAVVCFAMKELGFAFKLVAKEGDENGKLSIMHQTFVST